jgi:hypothetical protein
MPVPKNMLLSRDACALALRPGAALPLLLLLLLLLEEEAYDTHIITYNYTNYTHMIHI